MNDEVSHVSQLKLTAIIRREDDGFVSICPELDIASQGGSRDEARANLLDALHGFFEVASKSEIEQRLGAERYVEQLEVTVG
jgi:predicted RNase H-like HicB family nuclease